MNKAMIKKTVTGMQNNILRMMQEVNEEDLNNRNWYNDVHSESLAYAKSQGIDHSTFVRIIAVLSPFQKWENNIQSAKDMIETGDTIYGYKVNRIKALRIIDGDVSALRGVKVERFYYNIMHPDNSDQVTLDQWMYRIFLNDHSKIDVAANDKQFEPIQTEFIRIANEIGWHPVKLQAVLWVCVRRYVKENKVAFNSPLFS